MSKLPSEYTGPERRRRKVFLTRNTEYHFMDDVCVAVRQRDSGRWRIAHAALARSLSGAVRFTASGDVQPTAEPPNVGDALFFAASGADVITSALTEVTRPLPQTIESYPI
jgi:hypothetical protein